MNIGVDIDGTIKQTQRAAVEIYNRELDADIRLEDIKTFYLDEAYGLNRSEAIRMWRKLEPQIYASALPLERAPEVLNQLQQQGHQIYFVTARPSMKQIEQVTKEWLYKYDFPYNGNNLYLNAEDKAAIAKKLKIHLFFEDAPSHLDRLTEMKIPTVVINAVYNQDYQHLPRMYSWDEAIPLIKRYAAHQKS